MGEQLEDYECGLGSVHASSVNREWLTNLSPSVSLCLSLFPSLLEAQCVEATHATLVPFEHKQRGCVDAHLFGADALGWAARDPCRRLSAESVGIDVAPFFLKRSFVPVTPGCGQRRRFNHIHKSHAPITPIAT